MSVYDKILYLDMFVLGKNLIQQFYPDVAIHFFGSDIGASFFTYLLKDKEVLHKGTLFSLPGFDMFDLVVVVYFCDPFHNIAYVYFCFSLLAQNRLTLIRLVGKYNSVKQYVDILKVISLINHCDFSQIVLCLKILPYC